MVKVRVPATSANLGPGFDCLGAALSLWMRCTFEAAPEGELRISGCPSAHANADNLIYRAYLAGCEALGISPKGLHLSIDSQIPLARGLGSSAAAIVAGIAGAFLLHGAALDKEHILRLATALEGHPDNAAPAVYGGLRASMMEQELVLSEAFALSESLLWTALVPDVPLSTQEARAVLPKQVPHADAVFNASHALMLLKALETGDMVLLRHALQDRLHQRQRLPLIADGERVWRLAEDAGACVYLSGAGPTLMCLHQEKGLRDALRDVIPPGWQLIALQPDNAGLTQE